ncbi:MAG: hypothetical protein AAGE52_01655 [Myxococcota bacterium]
MIRRGAPVLAMGFAFAILALWARSPDPDGDTVRDVLIARDCAELGQCALAGPSATVGDLDHGVVWHAVVSLVILTGGDLHVVQYAIWCSMALAVAIVFAQRRGRGDLEAIAAALFYLAFLLVSEDHTRLWNPSLSPLAATVVSAGMSSLVGRADLKRVVATGFWAGLSVGVHVGLGTLGAGLIVLVASHRRLVPLIATFGAIACGVVAGGPDAARNNALWIWDTAGAMAVVVPVAGTALAWAIGPRLRREEVLGAVIVIPIVLAGLALWATDHFVRVDNFHGAFPAIAVGLGAASARLPRRWIVVPGVAAVLLVPRPHVDERWDLTTVQRIAPVVYAHYRHADVKERVQAPRCRQLVDVLSLFSTPAQGPAEQDVALALLRPRGLLPPGAIDLGQAYLRPLPSRVVWHGAKVCQMTEVPSCWGIGPDPRELDPLQLSSRAYPQAHPLDNPEGEALRWRIPLRRGNAAVVVLPPSDCLWEFADGARERTISADADTLELWLRQPCGDDAFFPCLVETLPAESELRAQLEAQ